MPTLSSALNSSWEVTAGVSLLLGVVSHFTIRPFEIDSKGWPIFFSYVGILCVLLYSYVATAGFSVFDAWLRTTLVANAFNVGLAGSILLYRAFFHRLHKFPGPFLAKLSRFYAMSSAAENLQANINTQKLHAKYGDFVRVGPREISIVRPSAINALYEPPTRCGKSPWYSQVSDDVTKISINSTRDLKRHKLRKRAWEKGLSFRALAVYEPRVKSKVDMLLSRIEACEGKPLDMTQTAMFFGFDVMGDLGFSKDFHMLESGEEHQATKGLHDNMAAVGVLGTVPWLMSMLSKIPGATGSYSRFTDWCGQELAAKREVVAHEKASLKDQEPRDVMTWLLKAQDEGDNSAPPGEGAFQEDSRLMIIAGSDTTSVAFTNALYYLTKYPETYRKLQEELAAVCPGGDGDWTYEKAKSVSYIDYIVQETLRLKPSIAAGLTRLTPPSGLQIDEVFIPGDTVVSIPTYTIQRDERYWDHAQDFIPQRWEKLSPEKAPWIPFSRGQFACPGRNLAFLELRMVLSRIALRYNLSFAPGTDVEKFDTDIKDTFTLNVPELPLIFTAR